MTSPRWHALVFFTVLLLGASPGIAGLTVTDVSIDPIAFEPGASDTKVRFRLSEPAKVTLRWYDGRDLLIRTIDTPKVLPAGEASLVWDGRDEAGRPVPAEAFVATLTAVSGKGEQVVHDLADLTGGDPVAATDLRYDAATRTIRYTLPEPARVNIRVGLEKGGPLLGTILDWVPRAAGPQSESWDGKDASGVLDLSDHPKRQLFLNAFALPRSTALTLPPPSRVELIEDLSWGRKARDRKRVPRSDRLHAEQPIEARGDVALRIALPDDTERTEDGAYRVSGPIDVRLEVSADDKRRLLSERFEAMFFVDGVFLQENELGYLPMTWRWDLLGMTPGEHYFTANVISFEGHMGAATVKIVIGPEEKQR